MPVLPRTRYATSGDLSIAYQVIGDGPLDIVVVPGFVSHIELIWEEPSAARFFEHLASFARVIIFDKRGMGLSDRPAQPPTLEQSMDDVLSVMDAADCERAILLGISEGGPMSLLCAATHPERVAGLIVFGTYPRIISADDYPIGIPEQVLDAFFASMRKEWGGAALLRVFAPSTVGDQRVEDWWARFLRHGTSPSGATALFDLYKEIDVRDVLGAIAVPTLVLHRTGDMIAPIEAGRYIAAAVPDARFVELDGADHLPIVGNWQAIVEEIEEFVTGARHHHEPDRVLSTVLFTDVVGSTSHAAEVGDRAWRELIERHDLLVRRQLDRYRGRAVKTMGDGFLATFDGPARAIQCAQAIAEDIRDLGLQIRAGLHTGECELRGDDVAGMAVNIGARVSALAEPGEVLVSSTVKDLVFGSGIEFEDRGPHALKGVPGEWRLYAVARDGR